MSSIFEPRLLKKLAYRLYLLVFRSYVPGSDWLRSILFRGGALGVGSGLVVRPGVYVSGLTRLEAGRNLSLNHNCFLSAEGGLSIGDDVAIGHGTSILTTEHGFVSGQVPIKFQRVSQQPVEIGSNVWIGANVTIVAGVRIADGCVVGAGAVVTRDIVERDCIVAGVPARLIGRRGP